MPPGRDFQEILPTFLEEARGYLNKLRDPDSTREELLRAAHSLKGAAAMVELKRLEACARDLERRLRREPADAPRETSSWIGEIEHLLDHLEQTGEEPPEPRSIIEEDWDPETAATLRNLFVEEAQEHLETITSALLSIGESDDEHAPIKEMLRKAHTLKGSASTVGLPRIARAAHLLEELLVEIREERITIDHRRLDLLMGAIDLLRTMTESAKEGDAGEEPVEAFAEMLRRIRSAAAERAAPTPPLVMPAKPPALPLEAGDRWSAYKPRRGPEERQERRLGIGRRFDDTRRVRVDVSRLDNLMNAVGELVIQRTRIEQRVEELKGLARDLSLSRRDLHDSLDDVEGNGHPWLGRIREVDVEVADAVANLERATDTLMEDSETLRRTTHSLQLYLNQIRMMPIRWLHARLQRPVREAAASQGKLIELVTEEETTEMDRSVVEQITDPLIHLVRNAVAHGIESPQQRLEAGKSATGHIWVRARHQGDLVFVDVEDDGAGIDPERLRQTLREQSELSEQRIAGMTHEELSSSIFASGFSTRAQADQLAGRGMGLDVVHRDISVMGGTISVASRPGKGTRFTIQMPISTGIAEAVLFKVGEPVYAIPVAYTVETVFAEPSDLAQVDEGSCCQLRHRGEWIPTLFLHRILGGDPPLPLQRTRDPGVSQARQPIIVLQFGDLRFGVTCTRVVGPREIVLKRLGPLLAQIPLFAAATISGSSKVQFVLDISVLARLARSGPAGVEPDADPDDDQSRTRILLVDDSRSVRAALGQILRAAGFSVDVAADGWEAWERLQLRAYALLLTDLEMPRLHGYELIAKCRRSPALKEMPILVLTSRTAQRNRKVALERGADGFLAKPINRRIVLRQIEDLLQKPEASSDPR